MAAGTVSDERDQDEGRRVVRGVLVGIGCGLALWGIVVLIVWLVTR